MVRVGIGERVSTVTNRTVMAHTRSVHTLESMHAHSVRKISVANGLYLKWESNRERIERGQTKISSGKGVVFNQEPTQNCW